MQYFLQYLQYLFEKLRSLTEFFFQAYSILTQLAKLPKEVMISTSIWSFDAITSVSGEKPQISPAQIFAKFLLNKPFVDHIYKITSGKKLLISRKKKFVNFYIMSCRSGAKKF